MEKEKKLLIGIVIAAIAVIAVIAVIAMITIPETEEEWPLEVKLYEGQGLFLEGQRVLVFQENGTYFPFSFAVYETSPPRPTTWRYGNGTISRRVKSAHVDLVWEGNFSGGRDTLSFEDLVISEHGIAWRTGEKPRGVVTVTIQ